MSEMSQRQSEILYYLGQTAALTAWQLSQPYRVGAPEASIRRDIMALRMKGIHIITQKVPRSFGGRAYQLLGTK